MKLPTKLEKTEANHLKLKNCTPIRAQMLWRAPLTMQFNTTPDSRPVPLHTSSPSVTPPLPIVPEMTSDVGAPRENH